MRPIYLSYRQIQQFTADVAHELRTPLAASQATVESALRLPSLDEKEARLVLNRIERQNRRLIQLVSDLLLLARMDQQSTPVRRQWCCLNDLVNDLVEELTALAQASQIVLIAEIGVEQPLAVMGDGEQLYRLVSNLIVNALQYTPLRGTVIVRLTQAGSQAVLQVQDTGMGIAAAEQQRIFDRFYRVQSDRSRHTGGSGLGLAIALAIAQNHRGNLWVQSELGKGSIFTVHLPLSSTGNKLKDMT
jgi:signal transduction histidine kinase